MGVMGQHEAFTLAPGAHSLYHSPVLPSCVPRLRP